MFALERIPPEEPGRIEHIIRLTREQLERRYPGGVIALRAQHAKDHACVQGTLKVLDDLPGERRRGVFATPGQEYQVWVRYSNAAASVGADSMVVGTGTPATHGSRGMALKIVGVSGSPLVPTDGEVTQDFLMVNHPVFPFANVEDYEAITRILTADHDNPARFFAERVRRQADGSPNLADPVTRRALRTLGIVTRIQSPSTVAQPRAYQPPPASPVDNQYFGGVPFLFGEDRVMRVRATPTSVATSDPDCADPNYLRTALLRRLTAPDAPDVRFDVQAQIRSAEELTGAIDTDIEDATAEWDEAQHPFVTLAVITIPPQDFDTAERRALCEALSFSPWHGIDDHRPLGGINRLRRAVYEASASFRRRP
jgi:hypothetical protein